MKNTLVVLLEKELEKERSKIKSLESAIESLNDNGDKSTAVSESTRLSYKRSLKNGDYISWDGVLERLPNRFHMRRLFGMRRNASSGSVYATLRRWLKAGLIKNTHPRYGRYQKVAGKGINTIVKTHKSKIYSWSESIKQLPDSFNIANMVSVKGCNYSAATVAASSLIKRGLITRTGVGQYSKLIAGA